MTNPRLPWGGVPPLFLLALALAFAASWGGHAHLFHRWSTQEEYSHGFFIPLIALWFLWKRREALNASLGEPSWWGVALLLPAALLMVLGELSALFILMQFGFLLALVGLVLGLGGFSLLRLAILPIALLVFAIPLPYFVDAQLSWRLQLLSSQLGVDVLRLLGTAVFLEGNVIDLGVYKLQVVEACSGLRYLYPLLSIGFLAAYLYRGQVWQRAILFLATIPVTVLMNSLRIALVGVLVERWGGEMADGFLHYFEGWIIFLACVLILLGLIWVFERFGGRRAVLSTMQVPEIHPVAVTGRGAKAGTGWGGGPLLAATVVLALTAVLSYTVSGREEIRPPRQALVGFPLTLGEWRAREDALPEAIEKGLGLDDYLLADYRRGDGAGVNFYVAYYGTQRKGVSPHSPQVCMPGGGWVITSLERISLPLPGVEGLEVNRTIIDRGDQRQLVYYWFEQRGRRIANEYWMKWYLLQDALVRNRTDGALVRLTTTVYPGEDMAAADRRLRDFVQAAIPRLAGYVPH